MKWAGLAFFALLLACSCTDAPARPTSNASSPPVYPTNPSLPTEPSPLTLAAGCRLPIYRHEAGPGPPVNALGFLNVCSGGFTPDPNSGFGAYIRPGNRWVPAGAEAISPDGRRYVYVTLIWRPDGNALDPRGTPDHWEIHVVEIIDKVDRVVSSQPLSTNYRVVKFSSAGVYLTQGCPSGCAAEYGRLWLLDPESGRISKVTDIRGIGWTVRGNYAWANSDLMSDPSFASSTTENPPWRQVFRLDLTTGETQVWASSQTTYGLAFLDSDGMPVISVQSQCPFPVWPRLADCYIVWNTLQGTNELYRLTSPTTHDFLAKLKLGCVSTAPEGTWLCGNETLYLYTPPRTFRAVAKTSGFDYYVVLGQLGD